MPNEILPSEEATPTVSRTAVAQGLWNRHDLLQTDTFFPLGFPLTITTNSEEVLEAAGQSWGVFEQAYSCQPLVITLLVEGTASEAIPYPPPTSRINGRLLITMTDAANFIVSDLDHGTAFGKVARPFVNGPLGLRYHFLETSALSMISTLRAAALHAACVEWRGRGLLLCGESGVGKSSLAFACAQSGWRYISDDATYLILNDPARTVVGNCHQIRFRDSATQLFPQLLGRRITLRPAGKPSIELPTTEFPGLLKKTTAEIAYIVFLHRVDGITPGLFPLESKVASDYFTRSLLLPPSEDSSGTKTLQRLLRAPRFELRYTDLYSAIEQIKGLVEREI
ncbi:aldolase [Edaphobacter sp. HDX4]|uniref:aldolase n=1 Tax=Edaphobacter sp. HDX4 TaxID=2794064 RepID=UPI002FE6727C